MTRPSRAVETGCGAIDNLLRGGFPAGAVSLIYGEARTGKTTLAMQCAINSMKTGSKVIYVNPDDAFSVSRFEQLTGSRSKDFLQAFLLLTPKTFREQIELIEELGKYVNKDTVLLVIDTITSLYRVEANAASSTFSMNKELNRQLANLSKLSKERDLVVLLTSQVHFALDKGYVEPPASRVLSYWAEVIVHLKETDKMNVREALLKRYGKDLEPEQSCFFILAEAGIRNADLAP